MARYTLRLASAVCILITLVHDYSLMPAITTTSSSQHSWSYHGFEYGLGFGKAFLLSGLPVSSNALIGGGGHLGHLIPNIHFHYEHGWQITPDFSLHLGISPISPSVGFHVGLTNNCRVGIGCRTNLFLSVAQKRLLAELPTTRFLTPELYFDYRPFARTILRWTISCAQWSIPLFAAHLTNRGTVDFARVLDSKKGNDMRDYAVTQSVPVPLTIVWPEISFSVVIPF